MNALKFIKTTTLVIIMTILFASCANNSPNSNISIDEKEISVDPVLVELDTALQNSIIGRDDILAFLIYSIEVERYDINEQKTFALIWLKMIDRETDQLVPAEAGLAIGTRDDANSLWQITLQADENWQAILNSAPQNMLDDDMKSHYTSSPQKESHAHQVYDGYRLPWEAGTLVNLTGSIGHVFTYKTCPNTCLYAFDFANGTNFPIMAAKSGIVRYAVWQYPDGNTKHANFIILEDSSTTPTTYQVYMHMSQNTIPEELRTPGAKVVQGQYIGRVDDTGVSTGPHLHFHVHTNPASYWGSSVDITFDDVFINGGRPRTCSESYNFPEYGSRCQSGNAYISGNGDAEAPVGGINTPKNGEAITSRNLTIQGWAKDDMELDSIRVKFTRGDDWNYFPETFTKENFELNIDLCDMDVPDGKFFIALEILDKAGKQTEGLPGLTHIEKQFTCPLPPPKCTAAADQIAVFENKDYQGNCQIVNIGESFNYKVAYTQTGSMQIGTNVYASFINDGENIEDAYYLLNSATNLSTERHNIDIFSSVTVKPKPELPQQLSMIIPKKSDGLLLDHLDSILLEWNGNGQVLDFKSEILGDSGELAISLDWTRQTAWEIGKLPPDSYTWNMWSKNVMGENLSTIRFEIAEADLPPQSRMLPYHEPLTTTVIPLKWEILDNAKDIINFQIQYSENGSNWTNWNIPLSGEVREAEFYGSFGSTYDFRMRAIDTAGNVESYPDFPESSYSIESICKADSFDQNSLNNSSENATIIDIDHTQIHNFCSLEDTDWFAFVAEAGQVYQIQIKALDTYTQTNMALIQKNNITDQNLIIMNKPGGEITHRWGSNETGTVYLRVTSANPKIAGTNTRYSIVIEKTARVFAPGPIVTLLLVPLLWFLLKFKKALMKKG